MKESIKTSRLVIGAFVSMVALMGIGCAGSEGSKPPIKGIKQPIPEHNQYISFESGPVRPVVTSTDGKTLYVTNTRDHRLELFAIEQDGTLTHKHSVAVGMEPVAIGLASADEVWVVNHLSDSVSVVDVSGDFPYVKRTLLTGDEPRDIVFANNHAFITTAHRGQQRSHPEIMNVPGAGDPELYTAGVGRADVWVFDANDLGSGIGGVPSKIIELFGDTPRGLAVSADGKTVYASVFHSGNQTSIVHESVLCHGFQDDDLGSKPCDVMDGISSPNGLENGQLPGGRTAPGVNAQGIPQPWTSMIVKFDQASGEWQDSAGRNFSNGIRFNLPDKDVFAIDVMSLEQTSVYRHVGTTLFNMAVHPHSGHLFVTNQEANNATRFEGAGTFAGSTVQGNIAKARITVIDPESGVVSPRHINRHIEYSSLKANPSIREHSLSLLTQLVFDDEGDQMFVAALGSNKIASFMTNQLTDDGLWDGDGNEFDPKDASEGYFDVAGGPVGLTYLKGQENRSSSLFVVTHFDNSVVRLDAETGKELQRIKLYDPEPVQVSSGRAILYDARRSSSNGEASCASCHIFGDADQLSWNLGNPDASNGINPQPFPTFEFTKLGCDFVGESDGSCQLSYLLNGNGDRRTIASMKGPMSTQTMRGMSTHGHLHWRGDRSVGYFGNDIDQRLDEKTSFKNFIVAFEGLLGLDIELPRSVEASNKSFNVMQLEADMDRFADFMLAVQMPPNPIRPLNNELSLSAQQGSDFFHGQRRSDGLEFDSPINGPDSDGVNCEGCHGHDPKNGFYGTRGEVAHGGEIQVFKVPQLRNLYSRVGMFGLPDRAGFLTSNTRTHQGDQVRGFGFLHDGATDMLFNFLKGGVFDNGEAGCVEGMNADHGCEFNVGRIGIPNDEVRQALVDFMMEFDSDLPPIVGQQVTLSSAVSMTDDASSSSLLARLNLLEERASTDFVSKVLGGTVKECELIAIGNVDNETQGFLFEPETSTYRTDKAVTERISSSQLIRLARQPGNALTFTCQPYGAGYRMALDRDLDGFLNRDEESLGTDTASNLSFPRE